MFAYSSVGSNLQHRRTHTHTHKLLSTDPNAGGTKWFKDSFSPPPSITGSSLSLCHELHKNLLFSCPPVGKKGVQRQKEGHTDCGPIEGLREEPSREGGAQEPNSAGHPGTTARQDSRRAGRQAASRRASRRAAGDGRQADRQASQQAGKQAGTQAHKHTSTQAHKHTSTFEHGP